MKIHSKSRTRKILASTWIIAALVASPYLYCQHYPFSIQSALGHVARHTCNDRFDEIDIHMYGRNTTHRGSFRKGFFTFLFVVVYVIPLITIVTTCVRIVVSISKPMYENSNQDSSRKTSQKTEENKRKVARMVVVVASTFVLSWTPFYLTTFVSQMQTASFLRKSNFVFVMLTIHLSGFINSCLNPFVYTCMSRRFRESFRSILRTIFCCGCLQKRSVRWTEAQSSYRYTSATVVTTRKSSPGMTSNDHLLTSRNAENGRMNRIHRNAFETEFPNSEEL